MPRSLSSTKKGPIPLRRVAIGSFRHYEQASPVEQRHADVSIISQLGKERSAMWSRWIAEVGGNFGEAGRETESAALAIPPPPEPPSTLGDDIAFLRSEIGRELLKAWGQLGRLALKEGSGKN